MAERPSRGRLRNLALSSEFGTHKQVMARFWPGLELFSRQRASTPFKLPPDSPGIGRLSVTSMCVYLSRDNTHMVCIYLKKCNDASQGKPVMRLTSAEPGHVMGPKSAEPDLSWQARTGFRGGAPPI